MLRERSPAGQPDRDGDDQDQDVRRAASEETGVNGVAVNRRLAASFVCRLAAGQYRFYVYATDAAGNKQSRVASNRLTVR